MTKYLISILSLLLFLNISAQVTVTVGSTSYPVNPSLLGLNGRSTEGPSWTDATFLSMVQEMNPSYVRYPAGTQGNQWNWKTGTFIASLAMNAREIFTIPMFLNGLPSNTKIIYMINMVLPTPQTGITFSTTTDAHLATDATLTAKIADILDALAAFQTAGHLPEVCEIGNELYFTNSTEAGVYAGDYTLYIAHAKKIVQAIKNQYPSMKILLCTTKGGTNSRDVWNNAVYTALSNDSQFASLVYGVVQHHYINDNYGIADAVTSTTIAKTIIDEGITYVSDITSDYTDVPSSLKLWVTEYGATKASADGMWASGLRTANLTLSFMKLGTKLDNLMWHHITDDPNILNSTKNKLGPSGIAFSLLSKAINGSTSYKKLVFSNMSTTNEYAGLTGYKFTAGGIEKVLIMNTENTTYSGVNLSGLTGSGTLNYAKQYWSSTPYITGVSTTTNISVSSSTGLNSYQINPFSITVFTKTVSTGITENNNEQVKLYPLIFDQQLNILTDKADYYTITDLAGRKVSSGYLNKGNNELNAAHFVKGMNLVTVGIQTYKVICK